MSGQVCWLFFFFFSSRRRHTSYIGDWSSDVCSSDLYLPTADGGRAITDAVRETHEVVSIGRALAGAPAPPPKGGARYHFNQIGRASCRERVEVSGGDGSLKMKRVSHLTTCVL